MEKRFSNNTKNVADEKVTEDHARATAIICSFSAQTSTNFWLA